MILLIDNYDSFTYNVYQLLSELGAGVEVIRNDQITPEEVLSRGYEAIVLSPVLEDFNEDLRHLGLDALRANLRVQLAPQDVGRFWLEAA